MIGPVVWAVGEYIYIGYDLDLEKMVCTIPRWGTIIMPGLVMIGPVVWAVGELYTQTHTHTNATTLYI